VLSYIGKVKVKESRNRPSVAQRVPGGLGSQIFMTLGTWRWWGRQSHSPAAFTPGMFLVLIFARGWVDPRAMVQSEGNMSMKNPVTPMGIDPGTVQLVAQCLNHYTIPGPIIHRTTYKCLLSGNWLRSPLHFTILWTVITSVSSESFGH
jgi:hypothetical protein